MSGSLKLCGIMEIYGMKLSATLNIDDDNLYSRARAYKLPNGKWRAFRTVDGIQEAFGCHDTKVQALEAARLGIKPATRQQRTADGVYPRGNGMWRVMLTIAGAKVRLGDYATRGHALLVRDVVARRAGLSAVVADYEMPLALVSHAVARSYIRDAVTPPTADELSAYERHVNDLNDR